MKKSVDLVRDFNLVNEDFKSVSVKHAFIVQDGQITWSGAISKIPKNIKVKAEISLKNKIVFPSFIECHTHSLFAGTRADEFELRNQGVSYSEIAARGGGILSTMKSTRLATAAEILKLGQKRVNQFLKQGVSTLEIKSGYALDLKNEIKLLQVAKKLKGPRIITTFLGAHALPPEFKNHSEYLEYLINKILPVIKSKKLSDRVDIFTEKGFFEVADSKNFLLKAKHLGFKTTVHANQLSDSGAADLALEVSSESADHVINLNESTISRWKKSNTVAVLLPAADLYMKCAYPPARKLIDSGVTVALATDFNPGSCPTQDLMLVGLLARLEMKMTLPEVFKAYTFGAAKALGIHQTEGLLKLGYLANFISTEASLENFFYSAGGMPEHQLFIGGKPVVSS